MPLTNAEKQQRFRKRNVLILTGSAEDIAKKLIGMADQDKLRKVYRLLGRHVKRWMEARCLMSSTAWTRH